MDKFVFIRQRKNCITLPIEKIAYLKSNKKGCEAITTSKERIFYEISLDEIEPHFPNYFFRVHELYLINKARIHYFDDSQICLVGGPKLPMTREGFNRLTEGMLIFDVCECPD